MPRARTAATASSAAVPTIMRTSVSAGTGIGGDAASVLLSFSGEQRDVGGGQPHHEGGGTEHDGLGRQYPVAPRAGGQGDADQAAAELGGEEHRGHDEQRDQPGERAGQGVRDGAGNAAVAAGQVGAISPDPVTVTAPADWRYPPPCGWLPRLGPPMSVPLHRPPRRPLQG